MLRSWLYIEGTNHGQGKGPTQHWIWRCPYSALNRSIVDDCSKTETPDTSTYAIEQQGISYRWDFPFALLAIKNWLYVRPLCLWRSALDIPSPDMMDWEIESPPPAPPLDWQQVQNQKKRRRPPSSGSSLPSPGHDSLPRPESLLLWVHFLPGKTFSLLAHIKDLPLIQAFYMSCPAIWLDWGVRHTLNPPPLPTFLFSVLTLNIFLQFS